MAQTGVVEEEEVVAMMVRLVGADLATLIMDQEVPSFCLSFRVQDMNGCHLQGVVERCGVTVDDCHRPNDARAVCLLVAADA